MTKLDREALEAARYELKKSTVRGDKVENAIRAYLDHVGDGWRDISSAPKDGQNILGWDSQQRQITLCRYVPESEDFAAWWAAINSHDETDYEFHPTKWQPLPTPPERES